MTYEPRTDLGKNLMALREKMIAEGLPPIVRTSLEELIAEVRNFLIGIRGDIRKVKLSVWTPEQFVLNMGLQTDKMERYLREVDGSHDHDKGDSAKLG